MQPRDIGIHGDWDPSQGQKTVGKCLQRASVALTFILCSQIIVWFNSDVIHCIEFCLCIVMNCFLSAFSNVTLFFVRKNLGFCPLLSGVSFSQTSFLTFPTFFLFLPSCHAIPINSCSKRLNNRITWENVNQHRAAQNLSWYKFMKPRGL